MEAMATEVVECLSHGKFGGKYLQVFRGVKSNDYVFDDEPTVKEFLALSEDRKEGFHKTYHPVKNQVVHELVETWGVEEDFEGKYLHDYMSLKDDRSHLNKYTTVIYSVNPITQFHEPIPDYIRWIQMDGELHYLSYEHRIKLQSGPWDKCAGIFIPSNILNNAYKVVPEPPDDIVKLLAVLAWVPTDDVKTFYEERHQELHNELQRDLEIEQFKDNAWYANHTKEELERICRNKKNYTKGLNKTKLDLVKLLASHDGAEPPPVSIMYSGDLSQIPSTLTAISKLPVRKLRSVLYYHGFITCGLKQELVIKVHLLKHGRTRYMFKQDRDALLDSIKICEDLIITQVQSNVSILINRQRMHGTVASSTRNLKGKILTAPTKTIITPPTSV